MKIVPTWQFDRLSKAGADPLMALAAYIYSNLLPLFHIIIICIAIHIIE